MSDDRTFERTARSWLELGPTDVPDRVIADALSAIETTPQERDLRVPWKDFRMTIPLRLATAAVIGVLAIGGGLFLLGRPNAQVGSPSPTPAFVATPPSGPVSLAVALQARWDSIGARPLPGSINPGGRTNIAFDGTSLSINGLKGWVYSSWSLIADSTATAPGTLELRLDSTQGSLNNQHWACHPGDTGTYTINVSAKVNVLSLTPVADACATRASILTGDWDRWPCPSAVSVCNPALAPGRHGLAFGPFEAPTSILSGFSYTVPSGWSEANFGLGRPNDPNGMGINVYEDAGPHSQALDCPDTVEPGVGETVPAIMSWLANRPGLVTTEPTPISVGGYSGLMLDATLAPSWALTCQYSPYGEPVLFTFTDRYVGPESPYIRLYMDGPARSRYILLDLGQGHNLLIDVAAPNEASWNELVQSAMPIIDSFQFDLKAP
jgi:hypothetical protein